MYVNIDDGLTFDSHIKNICMKASRQLNALIRIRQNLGYSQRKQVYESFILSNFNFCPIVIHQCSIRSTRKMEKIQQRALRFLTGDSDSSYDQLLTKTGMSSLTLTRMKNIATEVFKCLGKSNPCFMSDMYKVKESCYDMRKSNMLIVPKFKTMFYGKRSFRYNGCHLWNQLPDVMRNATSLYEFKKVIKEWSGPTCTCKMCNIYI